MSEGNGAAVGLSQEAFKDAFTSLQPAILAEWPAIDRESLADTAGDLEKVVSLVAAKTEHTKTLVRRQLQELQSLGDAPKGTAGSKKSRTDELLEAWEKRTAALAKELRETVLVNAREKVQQNVFVSILIALGLGLVVGLLFGGVRRERR